MPATPEIANGLEWFTARYPLRMAGEHRQLLENEARCHRHQQDELSILFSDQFTPRAFPWQGELRDYQARAVELYLRVKKLLVGDAVGLGKTLVAIGAFTEPVTLPASSFTVAFSVT